MSPVGLYLNSAAHGMVGGQILARDSGMVPIYFASKTLPINILGGLSLPMYSIDVQAATTGSGIQHLVSPQVLTGDGFSYAFATALSGGVVNPPDTPPEVQLDFSECAALVDVQFCDSTGAPVMVSSGNLIAQEVNNGPQQAVAYFGSVSGVRLAVRSGTALTLFVNIAIHSGTSDFSDFFSITDFTAHPINVGCDQIHPLKVIVPPSPGTLNTNALGRITGIADVLREEEHWIFESRPLVNAFNGPYSNRRFDHIEPLTQPGYQPCVTLSPQVGTPTCNSAGPFELINLLPSSFSTPSRNYDVQASFVFGLNRRYEFFATPVFPAVTVPSLQLGGPVNLGTTFEIDPGYVVGDVFFCGPDEGTNANSPLRHIFRASDTDSDGDGIPDGTVLDQSSQIFAAGLSVPSVGASYSADGGFARVLFEGDFVSSGVNRNNFVGDYHLTLGGFFAEATRWEQRVLSLIFGNVFTLDPDSYIDSVVQISNADFADVEIVPTVTITNHHRYGMSRVIIKFHTTSGILLNPSVYAAGSFNGVNFGNKPAQYTCGADGKGTPTTGSTATDGQVVLCIPEGTYSFNPRVFVSSDGGNSYAENTLQPILNYPVPPCAFVEIGECLAMTLTNLPTCATNRLLDVAGAVTSCTNVVAIFYELNGAAPVPICNNCGVSPSFAFNTTLADCKNDLKVTAVDANGQDTSIQIAVYYDITPPVLAGCTNITTNTLAGTNGNFVSFAVTALDHCDGVLPVTCIPASGSYFATGQTTVSCAAVDHCGNTNICHFTVEIRSGGCLNVSDTNVTCISNAPGSYLYSFTAQNLSPGPVKYLFVVPEPNCFTTSPSFFTFPGGLQSGQSANLSLTLNNIQSSCGDSLCMIFSLHDSNFNFCCAITNCIPNPGLTDIECPSNIVAYCTNTGGTVVNYAVPTATSLCCPPVTVTCLPPPGPFPAGLTTVTCTAVDACFNTNQCQFTVMVMDTTPPVFVWGAPTVNLVANGSFEAGVPAFNPADQLLPLSTGSPNVTGWTIAQNGIAPLYWANGSHASSLGTTYGPAADGDLYLYFNGSYDDLTPRGKITTLVSFPIAGSYRLEYDMWSEPSIHGSRDAGFTAELTGPASFTYTDRFTPPFSSDGTFPTVTAPNWQRVVHDFTVAVPGPHALSFTDASVYGPPSQPNAGNTPSPFLDNVSITAICCDGTRIVECGVPWHFDAPTAFDTCCGTNVTITSATSVSGNACSNVHTIVWTASDCLSNRTTCTQTVIVVSTQAPTLTCPSRVLICTNAQGCGPMPDLAASVAASAPCGPVTLQQSVPVGAPVCVSTGPFSVLITASDACGHATNCTVPITFDRCCVPPPTNMVNWWTFDEKKGTSANDIADAKANNGNLHPAGSTVPSRVPGMVGLAVCFNGSNQWMQVSHQGEVDFTGNCVQGAAAESFTIDAWIQPAQPFATAMLLDKRAFPTLQGYALSLQNGFLRVELNDASVHAYVGTQPLMANQWHFIALSYERCANVLNLYVDGNPADTFLTPALGNIATGPGTALLVARPQPSLAGNFFAGCLDELEYFKRALTAAEIQSIWQAGSAGKCKPGANLPHRRLAGASVADGQLALEWSGDAAVLQSADKPEGPWTDVDATSGYRVEMIEARRFYRLVYP